jgi:hypothetical protein
MHKGPQGQKRPADVIGKARAAKMTPERRAEIARKAAEKRWKAG